MTKLDIVLDLVRQELISNEEAEVLLEKEKEYIYSYPISYPVYPVYPYYWAAPTILCGSSGALSLTSNGTAGSSLTLSSCTTSTCTC